MSFCRFSEGDVYMIPTNDGIECVCCDLFDVVESTVLTTIDDAVEHLLLHCLAGHKAPYKEAIDMLRGTTIKMVDGRAVYDTVGEGGEW